MPAAIETSDHIAEAEIAGLDSPGGRTCLARALGRALAFERHNQVEQSHTVRVTFVPAAKLPGGTIAVHVLAKLPPIEGAKPRARYISVDASFFRVGPAAVALFTLGATRFPPATEITYLRCSTAGRRRTSSSPEAPTMESPLVQAVATPPLDPGPFAGDACLMVVSAQLDLVPA